MARDFLSDEAVELEIERLTNSPREKGGELCGENLCAFP